MRLRSTGALTLAAFMMLALSSVAAADDATGSTPPHGDLASGKEIAASIEAEHGELVSAEMAELTGQEVRDYRTYKYALANSDEVGSVETGEYQTEGHNDGDASPNLVGCDRWVNWTRYRLTIGGQSVTAYRYNMQSEVCFDGGHNVIEGDSGVLTQWPAYQAPGVDYNGPRRAPLEAYGAITFKGSVQGEFEGSVQGETLLQRQACPHLTVQNNAGTTTPPTVTTDTYCGIL